MPWTFEESRAGYGNMWRSAKLKPGTDTTNANTFADKIIAAEDRYKPVQEATGVPWFFIGALHMRESSCNFAGVLHNGEHIIGTGRKTSLVPAGRGPFSTWEEAAVDALKLKNLQNVPAWPVERMLYQAEGFNGWGYAGKGVNSPYVWAGTTHEQTGKYVADHVWDASAEDKQLGVAAVLIRLAELRPDIAAALTTTAQKPESSPVTDDERWEKLERILTNLDGRLQRLEGSTIALPPPVQPVPEPPPPPPPAPEPPQPTTFGTLFANLFPGIGGPANASILGGGAAGLALPFLQMFGQVAPGSGASTTIGTLAAGLIGGGTLGRISTGINLLTSILGAIRSRNPKG